MSNGGIVIKIGGGGGAGVDDTARAAIAALQNQKGQPLGIATLDSSGKVPVSQLPDGLDGVDEEARQAIANLANQKGEPEGIATLDSSGKVPLEQLPEGMGSGSGVDDFARQEIANLANQKGQPSGIATLDSDGKVPVSQLPEGIGSGGIDTEARASIAQLESQYNDIANRIPVIHISETDPILEDGKEGDLWFVIPPRPGSGGEEPGESNIFRYYHQGSGAENWVPGYTRGDIAQSKEANYLYLEVLNTNINTTAEATYVREIPIDLTYVTEVCFDAEVVDAVSSFNARVSVCLDRTKGSSSSELVKYANVTVSGGRKVYTLDVSDLTGFHFLKVAARDAQADSTAAYGKLKVYSVWVVSPVQPLEPENPYVPLYTEGVENVKWVEAYRTGSDEYATQSKQSDHLYLEIFDKVGSSSGRTYSTENPINVTELKQIEVDYESIDAAESFAMRFAVAAQRDTSNSSSNFVANADYNGTRLRRVATIDVENLTGEYYVRVCVMNSSSTESRHGKLKVYNVRGVKKYV